MSSKKVLLISEKALKEQSAVELNADPKVLSKVILEVQEVNLKQVLGNTLYSQLIDEVVAAKENSTELAPATKVLLYEYIVPYLIYAVLVDFIVVNNYKFTNKGALKMNDANANNITPAEVEYIKNFYQGRMSARKNALVNFLKDNKLNAPGADTNVTFAGTGWFLNESGPSGSFGSNSLKLEAPETDPVWSLDKNSYYPKSEVDALISGIQAGAVSWEVVLNKPASFPADAHTHDYNSLSNLPALFTQVEANSLYAPINHTHELKTINGESIQGSGNVTITASSAFNFGNGLTESNGSVGLGGYLSANTEISTGFSALSITGSRVHFPSEDEMFQYDASFTFHGKQISFSLSDGLTTTEMGIYPEIVYGEGPFALLSAGGIASLKVSMTGTELKGVVVLETQQTYTNQSSAGLGQRPKKSFWFDDNLLYYKNSNGVVKTVPLTALPA